MSTPEMGPDQGADVEQKVKGGRGAAGASTRAAVAVVLLAAIAGAGPPERGVHEGGAPDPVPAGPSFQAPDYAALWTGGQSYAEFRDDISARRTLWERNTELGATVPDDLLARARAVPGDWKLLVVAFDRCSDSVATIPFIAGLAAAVPGLDLRIILPEEGRPIMEANQTPDGRAATPTVLLLDDAWRPAGAWVERPSELQEWITANPRGLSHDAIYFAKMEWYADDGGASIVRELVELLEGAGL